MSEDLLCICEARIKNKEVHASYCEERRQAVLKMREGNLQKETGKELITIKVISENDENTIGRVVVLRPTGDIVNQHHFQIKQWNILECSFVVADGGVVNFSNVYTK